MKNRILKYRSNLSSEFKTLAFLRHNTQHCWNSKTCEFLFIGDLWVSFPYTCIFLLSCFLHIQVSHFGQCTLVYTKPKHADPLSMFPAWRQGFSQVILWLCFIDMHHFTASIVFKESLLSITVRPVLPMPAQLSVYAWITPHFQNFPWEWNCLPSALPDMEVVPVGVGCELTAPSLATIYLPLLKKTFSMTHSSEYF